MEPTSPLDWNQRVGVLELEGRPELHFPDGCILQTGNRGHMGHSSTVAGVGSATGSSHSRSSSHLQRSCEHGFQSTWELDHKMQI